MSTSNTPNLQIPIIAGDDLVSKEELNQAFEQIDDNALNKTHIDSRIHWARWKPTTAFLLKDVIRVEDCPTWGYLECTQAGTTGNTEPVGFYGEGDTRTDGTVKWTLRRLVSADTLVIQASQVKYVNSVYFNTSNVKQVLDMIPTMIDAAKNASEQYTDDKIADLINGAPAALDTLKELADAFGNDQNAIAAINLNLAAKVDKVAGKGMSTNDYDNTAKGKVDDISVTKPIDLDKIGTDSHTHANKALLDTYTQTEANLALAVQNNHAHSNKSVLDKETEVNGKLNYNGEQLATKKDAIKYAIVL